MKNSLVRFCLLTLTVISAVLVVAQSLSAHVSTSGNAKNHPAVRPLLGEPADWAVFGLMLVGILLLLARPRRRVVAEPADRR